MKKVILMVAGVYLLMAGLAFSQGRWTQQATVSVPFEFVAGDTLLPAGTYSVSTSDGTNSLILLTNTESNASAFVSHIDVGTITDATYNQQSNLVFVKDVGGHQVLHQVWFLGQGHGHDLQHEKGLPEPR